MRSGMEAYRAFICWADIAASLSFSSQADVRLPQSAGRRFQETNQSNAAHRQRQGRRRTILIPIRTFTDWRVTLTYEFLRNGRRRGAGQAPRPLYVLVVVAEPGDLRGVTRQPEDVQPGVRAVDDVDITAGVGRDVVRLDHDLARGGNGVVLAPKVGVARGLGDKEGHLLRVVGVADVDSPHTRVEVRDEDDLLVERRPELLIGGMRTEAATLAAEVTLRLRHLEVCRRVWPRLGGGVHHERQVAAFRAFVVRLLRYDDDEVADLVGLVRFPVGDRNLADREAGMPTPVRAHDPAPDFRGREVVRRG